MHGNMTFKGRVVAVLVGLVLTLAVLEIATRTIYEPRSNEITAFRLRESGFYQKDDELGWIPKRNIHGQHNKPGSFKSTFSTNAFGLRDQDYSLSKGQGMRRIVVLGDSMTWGFGVNDGETFADYLELTLENTEVINLGVTAYGLRQEIDYFKRLGLRFNPDIVILAFVMNDIYRYYHRPDDEDSEVESKNVDRSTGTSSRQDNNQFRNIKQLLARNLALYALFQDVINQHKILVDFLVLIGLKEPPMGFEGLDSNLKPALKEYPAQLRHSWRDTELKLLELKTICEESGIRFIIAAVPSLQSIERNAFEQTVAYTEFYVDDFDLNKPYEMLEIFGKNHGIEVISAVDAFRKVAATGVELYLRRDMHFNKYGHELFAKQIREHILDSTQ